MPNLKESVLLACIAVAYGLAADPDAGLAPEPAPAAPCPCPPSASAGAAWPLFPSEPTFGGPPSEGPPTAVPPGPHLGGMADSGCVPQTCALP